MAVACATATDTSSRDDASVQWTQLAVGVGFACALDAEGRVICWGSIEAPPSVAMVQIAAADCAACAVDADGGLWCWQATACDESIDGDLVDPPSGSYTDVDLGWQHACAIDTGQAVTRWLLTGRALYDRGQASDVPAGAFIDVAAGSYTSCAISTSGDSVCWGDTDRAGVPPGTELVALSAEVATCGLDGAGGARCWGPRMEEQPSTWDWAPTGEYVQVVAGRSNNCAIDLGGAIACDFAPIDGDGEEGQDITDFACDPPAGEFRSIGIGQLGCAVATDNAIECWGKQDDWECQYGSPPEMYR
jgi:hypothetical protein